MNKDNTINEIGGNTEVGKAKSIIKKNKKLAKLKNTIRPDFLAKSKILKAIKSSFESRFLVFEAKVAFIKLR